MQKLKAFIPNLFTLGNLLCGCLALVFAFNWRLDLAAYLVFLAAFLDFFDGFFARILKVSGELGKQLDSLADVVSFGVVPGMIMFQWLRYLSFYEPVDGIGVWGANHIEAFYTIPWQSYVALLIPLFSCYRLAKFNLDTRQSHGFIGLPTPANAIFFCSLVLIASEFPADYNSYWDLKSYLGLSPSSNSVLEMGNGFHWTIYPPLSGHYMNDIVAGGEMLDTENDSYLLYTHLSLSKKLAVALLPVFTNKFVLLALIVVFSVLLVAELPLFALKFKNFGWNDNRIRYIFLGIAAILLICFWLTAIPFIVILYLLLSILNNIAKITV